MYAIYKTGRVAFAYECLVSQSDVLFGGDIHLEDLGLILSDDLNWMSMYS